MKPRISCWPLRMGNPVVFYVNGVAQWGVCYGWTETDVLVAPRAPDAKPGDGVCLPLQAVVPARWSEPKQ